MSTHTEAQLLVNFKLRKISKYLKKKFPKNRFKNGDVFSSCGGIYHCCFLRNDKKIITATIGWVEKHIDFEISYKDYSSIDDYFRENSNAEMGYQDFGHENFRPNYEKRIWAITEEDL